jgi:uncharacterized OB-fold protein
MTGQLVRIDSAMTDTALLPRPGHSTIRIGTHGEAWIEGYRCAACHAVFAEATLGCRACASRSAPEPFKAGETGKLYTWSLVHRSFPGVAVPFVSAIVDLDDGLTLKGTLRADADTLRAGMPVRLVFDDAGGATDKEGVPYAGFHFEAGDAQ